MIRCGTDTPLKHLSLLFKSAYVVVVQKESMELHFSVLRKLKHIMMVEAELM